MMAKVPIRRFVRHGVSSMMQTLYSAEGAAQFDLADQGGTPLDDVVGKASAAFQRVRQRVTGRGSQ